MKASHHGFNGATLSRTWKRPRRADRRRRQARFNGATLSRTWKRNTDRDQPIAHCALQWSHAQPNVETRAAERRDDHFSDDASMEPRSAERGNDAASASRLRAKMLQWSHAQPNVETILDVHRFNPFKRASMEPRSAERGNSDLSRLVCWHSSFNGATLSRTWKLITKQNPTASA